MKNTPKRFISKAPVQTCKAHGMPIYIYFFIGKFPHLVVKESSNESSSGDEVMLSFGKVALGTECAKSIDLVNVSQVSISIMMSIYKYTCTCM